MKNSQVAVLCAAILAGVADRRRHQRLAGALADRRTPAARPAGPRRRRPRRRLVIAMMPKAKGDPYFVSCRAGAEEAAKELGVELIWDGPTEPRRRRSRTSWSRPGSRGRRRDRRGGREPRRHLDRAAQGAASAASRSSPGTPTPSPTRATSSSTRRRRRASPTTLTDEAARLLGGKGEFAIITGALSAANQNEWIAFIKKRLAEKYPEPEAGDDPAERRRPRQGVRRDADDPERLPDVKLIMAISAPAVPGAAEAVRQARRKDVKVIGLSLPNINKPYVARRHRPDRRALEHARPRLPRRLCERARPRRTDSRRRRVDRGRPARTNSDSATAKSILGAPMLFTKANIDQYDF